MVDFQEAAESHDSVEGQLAYWKDTAILEREENYRLKDRMRWIDVSDGLPNEGDPVLVVDSVSEERAIAWRSGFLWRHKTGSFARWRVTHWMPLPEPPTDVT